MSLHGHPNNAEVVWIIQFFSGELLFLKLISLLFLVGRGEVLVVDEK